MGEPIKVYDAEGNELIMHGAAYVGGLIAAGVVFTAPPPIEPARVVTEPEEVPAPVTKPQGKAKKG
jgi:hypothetical protein